MHYELWDVESGNLVGEYDTEEEALVTVRRIVASGWGADRLALALEYDDYDLGDDEDLPPVLHGTALAARASA